MKGKTQIQMDFSKAKQDAKKLDNIASRMKTLAKTDVASTISTLTSSWEGDCSKEFAKKEMKVQQDILNSAAELNRVANDIRAIAKRIYDAEMRAYEIASRRTS